MSLKNPSRYQQSTHRRFWCCSFCSFLVSWLNVAAVDIHLLDMLSLLFVRLLVPVWPSTTNVHQYGKIGKSFNSDVLNFWIRHDYARPVDVKFPPFSPRFQLSPLLAFYRTNLEVVCPWLDPETFHTCVDVTMTTLKILWSQSIKFELDEKHLSWWKESTLVPVKFFHH